TLEKKPTESFNKTNNIPREVMMLTAAQSISRTSMNRSLNILCLRLSLQLLLRVGINRHLHCFDPPAGIPFVCFQSAQGPVDRFLLKAVHNLLLLLIRRFR